MIVRICRPYRRDIMNREPLNLLVYMLVIIVIIVVLLRVLGVAV